LSLQAAAGFPPRFEANRRLLPTHRRHSLSQTRRPEAAGRIGTEAKRVFEIDMAHCPNCGGELKIIAAILEQPVIEKILTHLGLQGQAPPRAPARGPQLQAA